MQQSFEAGQSQGQAEVSKCFVVEYLNGECIKYVKDVLD